jgi:hypothetical protein
MSTHSTKWRRWISMSVLGAAIALAGVYRAPTANALESGDLVQFLVRADARQPELNDSGTRDGVPESSLIYGFASRSVDARGCAVGDKLVQSARLIDPGQHDAHSVGNPNLEVITTFQSGGVTTPVEAGTRVENLLFVTDCNIVVGDTSVAYKKYSAQVTTRG